MDFQEEFIQRLKEEGIPLYSVSEKQLERINEILKEMTDKLESNSK